MDDCETASDGLSLLRLRVRANASDQRMIPDPELPVEPTGGGLY